MVFHFSFKQQRFAKQSLYIPARCLMQAFLSHPRITSTGLNPLLSQLVLLQGRVAKMTHTWNYREVPAVPSPVQRHRLSMSWHIYHTSQLNCNGLFIDLLVNLQGDFEIAHLIHF